LLVQRLDEIAVLAGGADPLLRERVLEARRLAGGLDPYLARCTTPESPDLADLARRTLAYAFPEAGALEAEMLSGHVEGQLLQVLVRATGARRVLEVGMFTGYSALAMAEALPADGEVVACEIDADVAAFAAERLATAAHGAKVRVEVGPAVDTLTRLAAEGSSYDLVFIDADKPGYAAYLDLVLDGGLLAPGGLVCVDNTLLQGAAYGAGPATDNSRAIAAFNARVADDPRVQQVLVPLRDGVTLITRVPDDASEAIT
jgi:caffeoyl-CoA O-methyltransferase